MNAIQQAGEHLLTLINDILDFAKIEAGKLELYVTPVNLPVFLRAIVDMVRVRAEQKSLIFIYDVSRDLPVAVQADERRLRQVLLNLLGNAVKFTDRGQIHLRVKVLAHSETSVRLRFEIQDTGIGISESLLVNLFQPFEQVGEGERRLGGTGLGLAITRQLVQLMSSDVHVETKPGEGSLFWFELSMPVAKEISAPSAVRCITGYEGPRKKILIVDDVADNRAMLGNLLESLGFDSIEATNGHQGLEMARSFLPDCILMDIVMPIMDGLEATRRLRQLPDLEKVPVIALSAGAAKADQGKCLAIGANAFLAKPININHLLDQMGELLQLSWIYKAEEDEFSPDGQTTGVLVPPPPQEIEVLHQLALMGNMREIRKRAGHLASLGEPYRLFADKLRSLAEEYQSQAILSLIEEHLDHKEQ